MANREIVTERQIFLQEAFLESLSWGITNINSGVSLEDFLSSTNDLPAPNIFGKERNLEIPILGLRRSTSLSRGTIAFITGDMQTHEDQHHRYVANDYYAIVFRGSEMIPTYSISLYTKRSKAEVSRIRKKLEGKQTIMRLKKKSITQQWSRTFSSAPKAS